jgi:anaerobic selenocysteine-containing dehydrogenase/Ni/Fe-hydrogenase subunit HybB-like protein
MSHSAAPTAGANGPSESSLKTLPAIPWRPLLWAVWIVAVVLGAVGLAQRLLAGHLPAGYGSYVPWGLWVAFYFHGVGISGGAFVLGALGFLAGQRGFQGREALRVAILLSFAAILPSFLGVWLDLGRMERAYRIFTTPAFTSMMAFNAWMYGVFTVVSGLCWLLSFRERSGWLKPLLTLGVFFSVLFPSQSGSFFGVVDAKAFWHSALLPMLFLASAVTAGGAALLVVRALLAGPSNTEETDEALRRLRMVTLVAMIVYFVFEFAEFSIALWNPNSHSPAIRLILTGPYWWVFWMVHLGLGGAIPIALFGTRRRSAWVLAGFLTAVAFISARLNVLVPGQAVGEIRGLQEAFQHPRLTYIYHATWMEYLVGFLLLAVGMAVFYVGLHVNRLVRAWSGDNSPAEPQEPAGRAGTTGRRQVLAGGALLGTAGIQALAGPFRSWAAGDGRDAILIGGRPDGPYDLSDPDHILYSACLQCNTGCGIKCKLEEGVLTKIDGNPYNPWTLLPHLDFATHPDQAALVDGSICPKGQAGLQTAYDPYRLRKVLKRAGKRGENRWITVPFDQAVEEICEGGLLFRHVPGEEDRRVEGLRGLRALDDPEVSKAMEAGVQAIWNEKDPEKKRALVEAFRSNFADRLHCLIDPEHPDLGPRNNQIVLAWGRLKDGRGDLYKRLAAALGTVNAHGHTTVCQGSLYFTCKAISEQYDGGKFTGGKKFYWQADTENSRFVLFVGANLFEANYGPPNRAVRLTGNLAGGRAKIAVADPRFSKLASKAWKWLPLTPGTDAALALGIMRWIFDNGGYDARFLSCANKAAAREFGETSWTTATLLVHVKDGVPGKFVRAAEHGLAASETRQALDGKAYEEKFLAAMVDGKPVAVDPNDAERPVRGDLFVDATLPDGTPVKSGLQILLEETRRHSVEEWSEIAGVDADDVKAVARELVLNGKAAAVDIHRGPAQHTNGFYNVLAWMTLNMLLGNFDHKGGMIKLTAWDHKGKGGLFDLEKHPGRITAFGVNSIRHGVDYEKTTLFEGYPARRNWYPLSSDIYEEIIPSIGDAYPYPVKALFLYMGAPTYSLPAGHTNIRILQDTEKLPLFVASDIVIGTTSMYADYIFPDLSYLERWEFQGSHPSMPAKVQPVRQPVVAPIPEPCTVFGKTTPISLEAVILAVAERLGLPGFGPEGLGPGAPLEHPDDFYLRAVANLAFGEQADGSQNVPDADAREMEIFARARRHLPESVFDAGRWKGIVGDRMWPKVVHVLNRGGRFENHAQAYKGGMVSHPYGALLCLYQEKTASTIHAGTGRRNPGHAVFLAIRDFLGREPDELRRGYDLHLITHRTISQTKSRTIADPWLTPLMPENGILIHPDDAGRLGLSSGQRVRVTSATNPTGEWPLAPGVARPMEGKVILTQTVRPGVVSFALGFGHWATGAADVEIDGFRIKGEPRRAAGVHANAAMWVDPALKNTCLVDPVGGSVSFYDSFVRLEPVDT